MNPSFRGWTLYPDLLRSHLETIGIRFDKEFSNLPYQEKMDLLRPVLKKINLPFNESSSHVLGAETEFESVGCPYFKIWPEILNQLSDTSLNIDSGYLHFPYPVIEIRIPRDHPMAQVVGPSWLALLVTKGDAERNAGLIEAFFGKPAIEAWGGDEVVSKVFIFANMPDDICDHDVSSMAIKRETLQTSLDRMIGILSKSSPKRGEFSMPLSAFDFIFRVTVATAFFAIDMHELIAPDVKRNIVLRERLGKLKAKKSDRIFNKNKRWLVGSEIDLPRDLVITTGKATSKGNELTRGHLRSGHMRMQPFGPGGKDRKLVFIAPHWVRPDLPVAAKHGYRIGKVGVS